MGWALTPRIKFVSLYLVLLLMLLLLMCLLLMLLLLELLLRHEVLLGVHLHRVGVSCADRVAVHDLNRIKDVLYYFSRAKRDNWSHFRWEM